jgi:CDP-6-deoxy-D-xylo-4-hexulose-3-dehydrase
MTTAPLQFTAKHPDAIRREITALVLQFANVVHAPQAFLPDQTAVPLPVKSSALRS